MRARLESSVTERPIADYALLSDSQGAALVGRDGSIDWACLPRFDSPSVFARLLDDKAGHWQIAPLATATVHRRYLDDAMVLRTQFDTSHGSVALLDALLFGPQEREHGIGKASPHAIVRVLEGLTGRVEMTFELVPRPEYGLTVPMLIPHAGGARTRGGPDRYVISSPVSLDLEGGAARATFAVDEGTRLGFAFRLASSWRGSPHAWTQQEIESRLASTIEAWRSWSRLHQRYRGRYEDVVRHSGRVLQALTYAPTGAIVAAPTTSLPEEIGGVRNWDYRFSWVRDTSLTLQALWVAACPDEAAEYFDFFVTAAGGRAEAGLALQVMYGVGGERLLVEVELDHLEGYAASRPVRIGNGAWNQKQVDIYGDLLASADVLADQIGTFGDATRAFLVALADEAAVRWKEPDNGIWEVRGGPRHFLHSKLMCWVALDRAIGLARRLGAGGRVEEWTSVRATIRQAILDRGWSEKAACGAQKLESRTDQ
jgi:GH15 family glucan-1,4-alpha-glucosidase